MENVIPGEGPLRHEHDQGSQNPKEKSLSQVITPDKFSDIHALLKAAKSFYNEGNYKKAIEYSQKVLEIASANPDALNILSYSYYYQGKEEKAIDYCTQWVASVIQNPALPLAMLQRIYEQKARREEQAHHRERQARLLEQAKLEERTKLIGDLSHSIKNLISTVIDPLENLKKEAGSEKRIIENALRGANLIREIVNAMNLSSKGSIEDFYYDIKHHTGEKSFNLKTITISSLKYSVRNMFDGKYFSNFMQKYFPSRSIYIEAKTEWEKTSQSNTLNEIVLFLKKYLFEIEVVLGDVEQFEIGNQKGSAIKLLILFQELILNAVKYSAFVEKNQRHVSIQFLSDKNQISLQVANRFKSNVKTKTSGLGLVIVRNFAQLLNASSAISRNEDVYTVKLTFENLWKRNGI